MTAWLVSIDPSTKRLACVVSPVNDSSLWRVEVKPLPERDPSNTRSGAAFTAIQQVLQGIDAQSVYAFLEAPIYWRGGKSTIPLAQTSGAIQAAVALSGARLSMVGNQVWKKHLTGKGNADKALITETLSDKWSTIHAAHSEDQDIMDAAGIHYYAMAMLKQRARIVRRDK